MKAFLGDDFLLSNKIAEVLYHEYAANTPILDYHNHLSPEDIACDRQFGSITQAWLKGDHYKWRAMRANGIEEQFITGEACDIDKFSKWAETVPYTLRNPLYHWTHLELRRYFGIDKLLNETTASQIFAQTGEMLKRPDLSCRAMLTKMNVAALCTTDDPIDDLKYHQQINSSTFECKVYPTFRPEKVLRLDDVSYINHLSHITNSDIKNVDDLLAALSNRIDYFHDHGGRLADISFETLPLLVSVDDAEKTFKKYLANQVISKDERENAQAYLIAETCKLYHAKGWTQQFHLGVIRNNNSRALKGLGTDTGFDSMGDQLHGQRLAQFLDRLDTTDQLAQTIIYNLNPRDNELFATMCGNFQGGIPGKIQYGSGWWFLDQKQGMIDQMNALSNLGLLSRFIGMLTDSRSFLSFPRHEYFRRILCNLIGTDVENGELPNDTKLLGEMIKNICYKNAVSYLKLNL